MNETIKTIYERRAIRKYKDKPVDREIIDILLDAGRMAPSAINRQPWKFYVLTQKRDITDFSKSIAKASTKGFLRSGIRNIIHTAADAFHLAHGISFLKTDDPIFHGAPVVIFITSPRENEWAALDIGMCSQNMMLAAKSLGLDSCPVGLGKFVEHTKEYSRLNVPESEIVHLSIIVGYGDERPEAKERIKNNVRYI